MTGTWVRAYNSSLNYFYINTADDKSFYVAMNGPSTAWIIWADHKSLSGVVGLIGEWSTEEAAASALKLLLRGVDLSA